jgi:molybdate transport system substrate-binding protein
VRLRIPLLIVGLLASLDIASAGEIKVAVASNFSAARPLAERFERTTGHRVVLVFGSTGKHYTQIVNGAPFDLFLAADADHAIRLEGAGSTVPATRFTYAVGALLLWSPDSSVIDPEAEVLQRGDFRHLAIANPELAPYGAAAREVLMAKGLWQSLQNRLVRGENIAQAFQFVASGNAELGFIARSQVERNGRLPTVGSYWEVPAALHAPIEQQAVLLADTDAGRSFLEFLRSDSARGIIRKYGYTTAD